MGVDDPSVAEILRSLARLEAGLERLDGRLIQYVHRDVYFADKETQAVWVKTMIDDIAGLKADRSKFYGGIASALLGLVIMAIVIFLQAGG